MKKSGILIIVLTFLVAGILSAQDNRGLKILVKQLDQNYKAGRQYVLLIAIDKYQSWPPLKNPVKDAMELKEILTSKYYIDEVIELYNEKATKANIIKTFESLQKKLQVNDSLLVIYAGHGHVDKTTNSGFWIPVNAGLDKYEQSNWLPNTQIRGLISNIKSIHLLIISDSCFSGDLLNSSRAMPEEINNEYFKRAYARISRQIITSGASETVPDESEFSRMLKMALLKNSNPYFDPFMLFNEIRLGVRDSMPMFGNLKDTGHQDGASFLLFLREEEEKEVVKKEEIKKDEVKKEEKKAVVATKEEIKKSTVEPATAKGEFVALYDFEAINGDSVTDASGNGKNAILMNGPNRVSGKLGNAVDLDGSNDYVSLPAGVVSTLNDFTIACWVKIDSLRVWSRIFDFGSNTGVYMMLTPKAENGKTNFLRFGITKGSWQAEQIIESKKSLPTGEWKHVAVTLSENIGTLYIDGEEVGRNSSMTLKPSSLGQTVFNYIGRSQYPADPYLKGQIDDFRIYNRALSMEEVNSLAVKIDSGQTIVTEDKRTFEKVFTPLTEFEGHKYYLSQNFAKWHAAKDACEKFGGHLVTVTSGKENEAIVKALKTAKVQGDVWLGFSDEKEEGKWEWVTGEKKGYTNWSTGEPNNFQGQEDFGIMWTRAQWAFQWNDALDEDRIYILEIE